MENSVSEIEKLIRTFKERLNSIESCSDEDRNHFNQFFKSYQLTKYISSSNEQEIIGNETQPKCRICGENSLDKFERKAHVIPQLFGRANIISKLECDVCNDKFSKYETDLGSLTLSDRVILGQKKKKHKKKSGYYPVYKKNGTRISKLTTKEFESIIPEEFKKFENIENAILINTKDEECRIIKEDDNELTVEFETPSYIPINAFRALAKVYLILEDEKELHELTYFRKWLDSTETPHPKSGFYYHLYTFRLEKQILFFEFPEVWIFTRIEDSSQNDNDPLFNKTMVIFFGNRIYQIFIPMTVTNLKELAQKKNLRCILFPHIINPGNLICNCESNDCIKWFFKGFKSLTDLSSGIKSKNEKRIYTFE